MGCGESKAAIQNLGSPFKKPEEVAKVPNQDSVLTGPNKGNLDTQRAESPGFSDFRVKHTDFIRRMDSNIKDNYEILSPPIGRGGYGEVRRAVHRLTEIVYAVKIIPHDDFDEDDERLLMNEVNIQKNLVIDEILDSKLQDHPNIVKIQEFYKDEHFFYIISEYCSGGDLFKVIKEKTVSEKRNAEIMQQIFAGVSYLHSNGVVHRDLKPENILFADSDSSGTLKICDFGISRSFEKGKILHKTVGTSYYMSPEVLNGSYNEKCDLWSCGVILYSLFTGKVPFSGKNAEHIRAKIIKAQYTISGPGWENVSDGAKDLIKRLLEVDPGQRISAADAIRHEWIAINRPRKLTKKNTQLGQKILENMESYKPKKKFQDAIWVFLVTHFLPEEEKKKLAEIFMLFDQDKDGYLSKQDIIAGYKSFGAHEKDQEEIDEIFNRLDRNANGTLDYTEFIIAGTDRKKLLSKKNLEATFKMIDTDGSKSLSAEELKMFFMSDSQDTEWDDETWNLLVQEAASNTNGFVNKLLAFNLQISPQEFKQIMSKFVQVFLYQFLYFLALCFAQHFLFSQDFKDDYAINYQQKLV